MTLPASLIDLQSLVAVATTCREQGYAVVRELFRPEEVASLDAEARQLLTRADLIDTNNLRCRWQTDVETEACIFDAFDPIIDIGPTCAKIAADARIHRLLHAIYGEPACLFKDKLIYKPAGATGYALHQDYIAWPTFPRSFLTVVVAIDEADARSGCIEVFPELHRQGCLMPEDGMYHEIPPEFVAGIEAVRLELAPGDVALFGAFTPHRSASNRSRHSRRQLYLSYNAQSDGGDYRQAHYREFHAWLRDRYAEYGRTSVDFA